MFGSRVLTEFHEKELPEPEPSMIHRTFDAQEESEERVRFDIRAMAQASHMSSTIYLERRVKAKVVIPHRMPNRFTIKDGVDGVGGMSASTGRSFIRKPGFVLQQNLERANFSFNGGDCVSTSEWLAPYSKCYAYSLKPFVRGSGKNFSNQNDQVVRSGTYMTHDAEVPGAGKLGGALFYVNQERNDRRVTEIDTAGMIENMSAGENQLPWVGQPHDIDPLYFEHPDTLTTPIKNSGMFRPKRTNVLSPAPEFDYVNVRVTVGENNQPLAEYFQLDSDHSLIDDTFIEFYEEHWAADDNAKLAIFQQLQEAVMSHNLLVENNWGSYGSWNAIKTAFAEIFQSQQDAHAAHQLGIPFDDALYTDTLGWGVDLRHPNWDMKGNDAQGALVPSTRPLYLRTAAAMLRFADTMQRLQATTHDNHALYVTLQTRQRRIDFVNGNLLDGAIVSEADALLDKIDLMMDYLDDEHDGESVDSDDLYLAGVEHTLPELQEQYAQVRNMLITFGLPADRVYNQMDLNDYETIEDLTRAMVVGLQAQQDIDLAAYQNAFLMFNHWDHTTQNRDYIGTMQALCRWESWYLQDTNKEARSTILNEDCQQIDATFIEPMVIGPCRPTEYKEIGCWSKNSNILPYIERFRIDLKFKKDCQYFELDSYSLLHRDDFTGVITLPGIEILDTTTRLHAVFVEKPVALPVTLPYIDVRTESLGVVSLAKNDPQEIRFSELEMRRTWEKVFVYARMTKSSEYRGGDAIKQFPDSDKSASITGFQLSTDIQARCIDAVGRHRIDAMTVRNFPEYCAPVNLTGNVLGLVRNEIPKRKSTVDSIDHWNGVVQIEQDWSDKNIEVELFMSVFRIDTMLEIDDRYTKKAISMQPI